MYYADNSCTTPQMLRFAGASPQIASQSPQATQPALSAIAAYNAQPFIVQPPSNMYAPQHTQYVSMNIASQAAQDYLCMPNTAAYSAGNYAATMTQTMPSALTTPSQQQQPHQQQLTPSQQHHHSSPLLSQQVLPSSQLQPTSTMQLLSSQQTPPQQHAMPSPQQQQQQQASLQHMTTHMLPYGAVNNIGSSGNSNGSSNTVYNGKNHMTPVPSDDDRYRKQLIVNYLAPDVTSSELHALFSRFGPLDGARIIYDRQTCMPRGYGFVYFHYPESAKDAVDTMNGYEFHGKRLKVSYSTNPLNIISVNPITPC